MRPLRSSQAAEQLHDDTPARDCDDMRRLFTQLVTPGDDNDDLRRRATRDELAGIDSTVIDRYLAHRLLVTDIHPVTREPVLEVAHEALLREWPCFDDDGTELDLNVVQSFSTDGGPVYNRSLGTQWSLSDDALTETACRIVGRDLTEDEWATYIGDSVPYRATCSTA